MIAKPARTPAAAIRYPVQTPVPRPSSLVPRPSSKSGGSNGGGAPLAVRRGPRPYSPEYGAAPFGRCWKIPAKRPSQIETICFDLKRRSHRAIRSSRSITVLRKRSERRALRRGPLWRFLFPISFPLKEMGSRRSAKTPVQTYVPAAAGNPPGRLRIRRLSLQGSHPPLRSSVHKFKVPYY